MTAYISQAPTKLRLALKAGSFATIRLQQRNGEVIKTKEGGWAWVRDGRAYATEARMKGARSTRPANAVMVKITEVNQHLISFEVIS